MIQKGCNLVLSVEIKHVVTTNYIMLVPQNNIKDN